MELSLYLSFYLRHSLGGYMMDTTMGFPIKIMEALSPIILTSNPTEVSIVPYENLLCPPLSVRL
jgi:hypothetical protein